MKKQIFGILAIGGILALALAGCGNKSDDTLTANQAQSNAQGREKMQQESNARR